MRKTAGAALTNQYRNGRAFDKRLYDFSRGLDVGDFAGADFFLRDAAGLGGLGRD
jgi:hypothetical protein